jgi:SAM-dependent methyltransferase
VTPFYKRLVRQFPGTTVVGSEFLGEAAEPGTEIDGIRHEDGLRLSFPDASFDLILSNDVLEHVPDVTKAFGELRRVIRPGGSLLATFPFTFRPTTRVRAGVLSGRIEHFLPPIYHGNPLSSAGSLVFSDFGWDVLETCKSVGFSDAFFVCVHDMFRGYLGPELGLVLHAKVLGPRNE